jgi:hypothetical protein
VNIFKHQGIVSIIDVLSNEHRTGVNAFDKTAGGRDLILRAHRQTQLRWHDNFAQDPIVVVGRVTQATYVDLGAVIQNPARV